MISKKILIGFVSSLSLLVPIFASAQASATPVTTTTARTVTVATVNIYDSKIVSQDGGVIRVSFDLSNRVTVQPDIRYAIQLVDTNNTAVDEKIYDEVVNLGENQTIKKEVEYTAPKYLSGEFRVVLVARNQGGLMLALSNPGSVTLKGDGQYVELRDCYLKVDGEAENKVYSLMQGVDVKPEEKLVVYCSVENHTKDSVTFTPKFTTNYRTVFGKVVSTTPESQTAETLKSQEKKQISFIVPKPREPQAYDATLELQTQQDQILSNKITMHYVVRGLSATVQNLRLDKDYYREGDIAKVSFFWSASADNFPESRFGATNNSKMLVSISIKNSDDQTCAASEKELDQSIATSEYELPISIDCKNPQVSVSIHGADGVVLDKRDFSIESKGSISAVVVGVIIAILLVVVACVVLVIRYRNKKSVVAIVFLLMVCGASLVGGNHAKADTFNVGATDNYDDSPTGFHNTYTVNLNKSVYNPGENIIASGAGSWSWCGNTTGNMALNVTINNVNSSLFNLSWRIFITVFYDHVEPVAGQCSVGTFVSDEFSPYCLVPTTETSNAITQAQASGYSCAFVPFQSSVSCTISTTGNNVSTQAPMTPGNYTAVFSGCDGFENNCTDPSRYSSYSIPYTVLGPSSCNLPWGGTIANGQSVTAYSASSVPCGSSCGSVSQTRTCNSGILSGSYTNQSCSVAACAGSCGATTIESCSLPSTPTGGSAGSCL